jgi:hypothetical protein
MPRQNPFIARSPKYVNRFVSRGFPPLSLAIHAAALFDHFIHRTHKGREKAKKTRIDQKKRRRKRDQGEGVGKGSGFGYRG